ncbi:PhzF family phenazine biosynthesis protein [Stenotrophobium rhamnosiphilum]|uniref:Isomerase n=1 Tax=Stenotrophobium rhamnosiphilum TaxID=2029166 RepID=A0A2T5MBW0_9GAMM|nr:PhzF family phenazine biosynthesis protein [Stenotrophobium rhamnosiphilum]PTU30041.1 isomerase [Stenotrophobium rhamnosiphilum]
MTKTLPLFIVDVFAEQKFAGNPAGVCPLNEWLPDSVMQSIAAENNQPETAFFVRDETGAADYLLRWFTPTQEIELCGHATLASGYVLFNELAHQSNTIRFRTMRAGILPLERRGDALWLALPTRMPEPLENVPNALLKGLGLLPDDLQIVGNKYFAIYESAEVIAELSPDMRELRKLTEMGVVVTAPGRDADEDFVSRFFAPGMGIDEDPATGSAHCLLVPYWAKRLGKTQFNAMQLSARGARFTCELDGERVWMSGKVQPYLKGEITVAL